MPPGELGSACKTCGRSFLKREGANGVCRTCAKTKAPPREERFSGASLSDVARIVKTGGDCKVADCQLSVSFKGFCRPHYELARIAVEEKRASWDDAESLARALSEPVKKEERVAETAIADKNGVEVVAKKRETLKCGECGFTTDWGPAIASHAKARHGSAKSVSKERPARKPPLRVSARALAKAVQVAAGQELEVRVGAALPGDVGMLLALAELEPGARTRVLGWANARWPSANRGGAMIVPQPEPGRLSRICGLTTCRRPFTTDREGQVYCQRRCRERAADRARRVRDRAP